MHKLQIGPCEFCMIQQLIPANAPSIKDSVFEDEIASKGLRENSNRLNESIT